MSYNQLQKISNIKNDRECILAWLDFGPYAYVNFGIISELSKLNNFDFVGIVTTRQDMSFFQNQKIIPFKKIIYYPDCYINKSSFKLDILKKFEEKYELNIWRDVFSERSFYKYWVDFHKFTKEEIFSIIENSISFFVNILESEKPRLVFMQQPGENISNLLLYRVAKKTGIRVLTPNPIYIHNKVMISDNIDCREISEEFAKIMHDQADSTIVYDEEYIKNHSLAKSMDVIASYTHGRSSYYQKIKRYLKRLADDPEPLYKNAGKTKFKLLKNKYQTYFKVKNRKKFLDENAIKSIKDEKFIYFPLQSEPEAIVLIKSPYYANTVTLVENTAKSIPIDMVLYVKEHPIQKEKLWRPIEDYQRIIDIPNVKLVHPSVNSQNLISKSQAVICLSGATGLEALFYKKPVILFSDEYYDVVSMIKKVKKITELASIITDALDNFKFNNMELNALMQATEKQAITIPYFPMMKEAIILSSIQKNGDTDSTINNFQNFYTRHNEYLKLAAQIIHAKM
ncbi:MAG: hypothetical protein QXN55_07100 [Candidatus Nitrosotenuis sp.]